MLPALDERLAAAARLARPGLAVADIGCDHGKLTVALAASGLYPKVIGADLRTGPLAKAESAVKRAHCEDRVELRLGDGLSVLAPGEVGTIIIAGVSAKTICQILEPAGWIFAPGAPRLVLVPATRHTVLRQWLAQQGFELVCDRPIMAAGRWYAVMAAEYTGKMRTPSLAECIYGRTGEWPGSREYAAWQCAKLKKYRIGIEDGSPLAEEIDLLLAEQKRENDEDNNAGI